jgi:hypothetical protein
LNENQKRSAVGKPFVEPVQGLAGALRPNHGEHDRPEATALVCPALVAELA